MNYKSVNIVLFLFLAISLSTYAQKGSNRIDKEFPTPISFPFDFLGNYSGNLRVSNATGTLANHPTEFSIKETETKGEFVYSISYFIGKEKQAINYQLRTIDQDKGFYAIKDDSGMEFTAIQIENILYSTVEIDNTILFTTLHFTNDEKVRLNIFLSEKVTVNKKNKNQAKSANIVLMQKAVFSKVYN
ncbi:hypothetical protein [Lacinutrix jangbogonensis]|uniref:hypothetical protein n=1 Tax=Lacinutrix jangbogonensis TaxID=1469557 RepID=UPI00053DE983|nr:hypothetical protein [Lacinutrix jangbogonensis]